MSRPHCKPSLLFSALAVSAAVVAAGCSKAPEAAPAQGAESAASEGSWDSGPEPDPIPQALEAMPVEPSTGPHAPNANPFEGAEFFVNPKYVAKIENTMKTAKELAPKLKKLTKVPTAIWLDSIASLEKIDPALEAAGKQQKAKGKPVVPVFVVYDLPNRDCSAKASAGELSTDADGEARYRSEFIDPIAKAFAANPKQRIVAILEPDSLPNMATNLSVPKCAESDVIYRNSVAYAISKLSLPNVYIYLDAAHAGWLGWDNNRNKMAQIFKEVIDKAGGPDTIRGFATNVSNFNAIEGEFGKKLEPSNPAPNELTYVQLMAETLEKAGISGKGFIIDTARNGQADIRSKWGNWCNVKGAGLGERPKVQPTELLDAYFWIKPPGESDGVADPNAPRFDENCASQDAAAGAPQAGEWFESYLLELVKNANPPL